MAYGSYYTYRNAGRSFDVGYAVAVPWMWEGVGGYGFEQVKLISPKIAVFIPDFEIWGYKQNEYAPEAVEYLQEHYTKLEGTEQIYVRKDFYDEAYEKIQMIQ